MRHRRRHHLRDCHAAGAGGLGIVRVSGPEFRKLPALLGFLPAPRYATLANFTDAEGRSDRLRDRSVFSRPAFLYRRARAGTAGSWWCIHSAAAGAAGAEPGRKGRAPGEFSERAFLNDKLDLVQAEAIADLIDSGSDAAARAAQRSLQGVFSSQVRNCRKNSPLCVFRRSSHRFSR